jgi:hypothetical protein
VKREERGNEIKEEKGKGRGEGRGDEVNKV